MKETSLNNHIREYNVLLKNHELDLNQENILMLKFNNITEFINKNKTYEFKINALSTESLRFLKERKINLKIEHTEFKETSKSKIHNFINSDNLLDVQNYIIQSYKNEQIWSLKEVIFLIESELHKVIGIEFESMKKLTKSNLLFAKKKKQIFLNLSYHFRLNEDEIIILLNEQNFKYETLNKLFDLMENELNSSEIKTYDFLRSLLYDKKTRKKLGFLI